MKLILSGTAFTYPGAAGPALFDCNLELDTSVVTVMVGNNGAGKSTLIRLLTGQLFGYAGNYTLGGKEAETLQGELLARHGFGYVPDVPVLDPLLTGREVCEMAGAFRGLSPDRILSELSAYAELFELGDWFGGVTCDAYSKGMRKKTSLVIGFLGDPAFTILDEPFDGLDPVAIYNLKRHLKDRRERGMGALVSSHMLDAAEKIADDLIIMKAGTPAYAGGFQALLSGDGEGDGNGNGNGNGSGRSQGKALDEIYFEYFRK